jgi:hypothetical protein
MVAPKGLATVLEMLGEEGDYELTCHYRHSNKTRQQWHLKFELGGRVKYVQSERLDLLLWRVIGHYRRFEREGEIIRRLDEIQRPEYEI